MRRPAGAFMCGVLRKLRLAKQARFPQTAALAVPSNLRFSLLPVIGKK